MKNAYLNFMRLGAIARRYLPNCYGVTTSPLHGGMPTDRLIAEWWLDSPRVNNLLNGAAPLSAAFAGSARGNSNSRRNAAPATRKFIRSSAHPNRSPRKIPDIGLRKAMPPRQSKSIPKADATFSSRGSNPRKARTKNENSARHTSRNSHAAVAAV